MSEQPLCELCGDETDQTVLLEHSEGAQQTSPCCEKCAGSDGDSEALVRAAVRLMLKRGLVTEVEVDEGS